DPAVGNSALVRGPGSLWRNSTGVQVGQSGAFSSLVVSNGGAVLSSAGTVGAPGATALSNAVLVTGAKSVWSNSPAGLSVYSSNAIVLNNGGTLVAADSTVYGNGTSIGVSDSGSAWSNFNGGFIVSGSFNSLVVSTGGLASGGAFLSGNSN